MYAWQFSKALYTSQLNGWARFATMQNHYNLMYREEEREMLALCRDQGVGVLPWTPLARGRLTRDWDTTSARSETDVFGKSLYQEGDKKIVEAVARIAADRGVPRAQVALAWVASRPGITAPLIGLTKEHHLDDALRGVALQLTAEEVAELEAPYTPHPVAGF
jgi:aryl-alcohol dehydrogenase (NADP+)